MTASFNIKQVETIRKVLLARSSPQCTVETELHYVQRWCLFH